jgi:hypothetical protein
MSTQPSGSRRACAELRFSATPPTIPAIAGRVLHQYWPLLSPHFRGIFLPPQWRDGTGLTWTWRETAAPNSFSAAELITLRKRLTAAQRSLTDTAEDAPLADARRAVVSLAQIQSRTQEVVAALLALPDPVLAAYVVRTDHGPVLHSWGLSPALVPFYPDATDCEISGTVFRALSPAPAHEVLLETPDGKHLARTPSDANGRFRFPKISPGHYRVRVASATASFPSKGLAVEVQRTALTGLELHDVANARPPFPVARARTLRRLIYAFAGALALLLIGFVFWRHPPPLTPHLLADSETDLRSARAAFDPGVAPDPGVASDLTPAPGISASITPSRRASHPADFEPAPRTAISRTFLPRREPPAPPAPPNATASAAAAASSIHSDPAAASSPATAPDSSPDTSASAPPAAKSTHPTAHSPQTAAPSRPAQNPAASATPPASAPTPNSPPPVLPSPVSKKNLTPTAASSAPARPKANAAAKAPAANAIAAALADAREAAAELTPPDLPKTQPIPTPQSPPVSTPLSTPPLLPSAPPSDPDEKFPPPQLRPPVAVISPTPPDEPPARDSHALLAPPDPPALALRADALRIRLHLTPWRLRLLRDTILPTYPARAAEQATVDALRARLFSERQQQIPASFQHPLIQRGFALDLPPSPASSAPAFWRDAAGATPAKTTANATSIHAEFTWRESHPQPTTPATFTLFSTDHRELARVTFDTDGEATLTTATDVQGWPWLALVAPDPKSTARFDWQVLHGPSAPATWRRPASAHRLDLIAPPNETGLRQRTLALVDETSGWALVSELSTTGESP